MAIFIRHSVVVLVAIRLSSIFRRFVIACDGERKGKGCREPDAIAANLVMADELAAFGHS